MRYIFAISAVFIAASAFVPTSGFAQLGTLQGGRLILNNGTNTATLVPAATTTSYTLTLPSANTSLTQYLGNDGAGNCFWGIPASSSSSGEALYNASGAEPFNQPMNGGNYTIDVGYSGGSGNAVGALINVVANGPSNTSLVGLGDTSINIYTPQIQYDSTQNNGMPDEVACGDTASLAATGATGTAIGIKVSATGGGHNYAAITKGGSVCIGVTAGPTTTDSLEVKGNVLISGQNGLKIQEGTNACMGTATLNGTTAVTVASTEVTVTCRILLTIQNPNATVVGTPFVVTQTAGTGFTIESTATTDRSTVAWMILLP